MKTALFVLLAAGVIGTAGAFSFSGRSETGTTSAIEKGVSTSSVIERTEAAEPTVSTTAFASPQSSREPASPEASIPDSAREPSPPAAPVDTSGWTSFADMDLADYVTDSAGLVQGQPGSMRVVCFTSHFSYDDPIVFPGEQGAAHLHMYWGNTLADYASTHESLTQTGKGTCNGGELNRSAYWIPALIDPQGRARLPLYNEIYYKSGPMHGQEISELPEGLRMIAGNAMAMSVDDNDAQFGWHCGFPGNYPLQYGNGPTIPDCEAGDALTLSLAFPQCWDGENLDAPNHRDHMAYSTIQGAISVCPTSHPVILPQITYNIYWNNSDQRTGGWHLASDRHEGHSVPGGTTTHGDWFGAWHPEVMSIFVRECNNRDHDCAGATISPTQRLAEPTEFGINDGEDIYNPARPPQTVTVADIPKPPADQG